MTRTETDVRNAFTEPEGIDGAEARVIASFTDPEALGHPARVVPGGRSTAARWATAGASAAAVAAIATTALVVPGMGHHAATRVPPVDSAASRPSSAPVPVARPDRVTVTPQVVGRTLIKLLPRPGSATKLNGQSTLGEAGSALVYDDGHGAAKISASLDFPYTYRGGPVQRRAAGSLCPSITDGDPCHTLPDGSQVATYQGNDNVPGGPINWEVRVLRPDGVGIDISEYNAPLEKMGRPTRPDPPFTLAELTAIARSPMWQPTVTAAEARSAAHLFRPQHS